MRIVETVMDSDWDDVKSEANERKHGVPFPEAMTVFGDPLSITACDPQHAAYEDRFLTMGLRRASDCWWYLTRIEATRSESSVQDSRVGVGERITRMETSPDESGPGDDPPPDCEFRSLEGVVRGKYAERYRERLRLVGLAPDVSGAFSDEDWVDAALREYLEWRRDLDAARPG